MTRRLVQWAESWPVVLAMGAWLAVFAWQHVLPGEWRDAVDLPDARAGAAVPDAVQGPVLHRID